MDEYFVFHTAALLLYCHKQLGGWGLLTTIELKPIFLFSEVFGRSAQFCVSVHGAEALGLAEEASCSIKRLAKWQFKRKSV